MNIYIWSSKDHSNDLLNQSPGELNVFIAPPQDLTSESGAWIREFKLKPIKSKCLMKKKGRAGLWRTKYRFLKDQWFGV